MLDITQTEVDRTLTVRYTGELDQHTARQTIERSEDLLVLYPCDSLVLDLSGLTFMDSSGLAVVLHLHRTCAPPVCRRSSYSKGVSNVADSQQQNEHQI